MEIQWRQILLTLQKKKGRKNWLKIVHHSHQYVAVCLNKKSGSLAMTKGQLISERHLGVFKSPKKRTFFVRISAIASNWSNPWNFHTKILSISRAGKHFLLLFWLSGFSIKILCPVGCLSLAFLNWDSQQGRDLATSGCSKKKIQLGQSYSYIIRKVWYHQIWIQTYLGFIVLILLYIPSNQCISSKNWREVWIVCTR